jgi:FkbM family methyltransferase
MKLRYAAAFSLLGWYLMMPPPVANKGLPPLIPDATKPLSDWFSVASFRLKYDLGLLDGFTSKEDLQYFEDFLNLQLEDEVFIDAGAFDGFTTREFIKRCPQFRAVHAFEPEAENFQRCQESLSAFANVHCYQMGLSSTKHTAKFDKRGSASKIDPQGTATITLDALDNLIQGPVTFIKMDLEGAEGAAIKGAARTISTYRPRLAIAVYHTAGDFWRIPETILDIYNGYKLYLRHYTESIYETIMFFVPLDPTP